jgi:hypothetical protein
MFTEHRVGRDLYKVLKRENLGAIVDFCNSLLMEGGVFQPSQEPWDETRAIESYHEHASLYFLKLV